jgi:hypothetical protein
VLLVINEMMTADISMHDSCNHVSPTKIQNIAVTCSISPVWVGYYLSSDNTKGGLGSEYIPFPMSEIKGYFLL